MLADLGAHFSLIVAYSGGADSTALLLMAHAAAPGRVGAVHVHHGLQAAADDFAAHAQVFCQDRGIALAVLKIDAQAAAGQSPEDAARRARYRAIAEYVLKENSAQVLIKPANFAIEFVANQAPRRSPVCVLLGQHADDQVETLLLALSRGAGVDGMAGMAARFERHGVQWARPFLSDASLMGSQAIRQWLAAQGLQARQPDSANLGQGWVEDPSNQSMAFTRNRIRAELVPALAQVFPQYRQTFVRSARNMAQSLQLLAQSAIDLEAIVGWPPSIKALQGLPEAQQAHCLRYWLKTGHHTTGSQAQLQELLRQIKACTTRGHSIRIKLGAGWVLRSGDVLGYELNKPLE